MADKSEKSKMTKSRPHAGNLGQMPRLYTNAQKAGVEKGLSGPHAGNLPTANKHRSETKVTIAINCGAKFMAKKI